MLELRLWQGKREGVEAGIIWLRTGAIFTEAGVAQRGGLVVKRGFNSVGGGLAKEV